jgi:transcriptional regulator with XRE-family HTH domain
MSEKGSDFAVRLRQVMADLNVSRLTLAREIGVDKSVIGRWLGGANQPTGHNLTRLTDVVRRRYPDATLDFWQKLPGKVNGNGYLERHEPTTEASEGLVIAGLHAKRRPEIDANYLGLWAGFYHSTQNRGSVVLAVMHVSDGDVGLRCIFTEGKVSALGAAVAIGPRLHVVLEIEPLHDRLCLFIFNGVGSPDAMVMDGIYMISAGDAATCVAASPVALFRIGGVSDLERAGGLDGVMQSLYPVNAHNIQESVLAGDPVAGLADLLPESMLRLVCARVGTPRADGEIDHVLRMPSYRSLPASNFGLAELHATSPMVQTRNSLRRVLGLEQEATAGHLQPVGPAPVG